MTISKINRTAHIHLIKGPVITSETNGNAIYKSIIDEETVHIPASDDNVETYVPYHAIGRVIFSDTTVSADITDDVCNEEGGEYTGEVEITITNNSDSVVTVALFEKWGQASEKWSLNLASGATETRTGNGGEILEIVTNRDNITYEGADLITLVEDATTFALTSATANFTIRNGQQ